MKLSEREREAHRQAFQAMSLPQKLEYVLAYYKLPLVLMLIALVALGSFVHRMLTEKHAVLYLGYANVSVAEDLNETLTLGFLTNQGRNSSSYEVATYPDLYLSEAEDTTDHQYSYASRLKLVASIDAEQLDVVLMNRTAYDLLSHSGFLLDLTSVDGLSPELKNLCVSNDVILEDNALEVQLNEADTYQAVTQSATNALDLSGLPAFSTLSDNVYIGVIANTPRLADALRYLEYLCMN